MSLEEKIKALRLFARGIEISSAADAEMVRIIHGERDSGVQLFKGREMGAGEIYRRIEELFEGVGELDEWLSYYETKHEEPIEDVLKNIAKKSLEKMVE